LHNSYTGACPKLGTHKNKKMNYLLGYVKIPKDLTVTQLKVALTKLSKEYGVKVGVDYIKDLNETFYQLKIMADGHSNKVEWRRSERIDLVIDNHLNIYNHRR
jgi:hypothetical protein